jgi:serine/threonine protein kinase
MPVGYTGGVSLLGDAGRPSKLGRYELISQIGQGGMAEVQLALQRGPAGFEKLVVVKLVHENLATQKPFVDMLLDEARMAALVKHPNVVDIYDLGEVEGRYFIAMEYLEGEPLLAVLRAGREGTRLDPLSTTRLIADTAEGLDAAHELRSMAGDPIELVHHDVSLGNIVVLYNGQVKLVDFGVAKASMSTAGTKVQGKFSYMAPEKLRGGAGDRRSDIWSLGCVLWEALTLRRLFKGGNESDTMKQVLESAILPPSQVNAEVPKELDPIVLRSLAREPGARYPTAKEMAQDLEEVLRKQGYGGKNDVIARYMQSTFRDHIAARKRLLQEVSSKGRASEAVLQAAFADSMLPQPELPRLSLELAAEGTPHDHDDAAETVLYPQASRELIQRFHTESPPEPIGLAQGRDAIEPLQARPRVMMYLLGGALVAGIVVGIVIALTRKDTRPEAHAGGRPPLAEIDAAVALAPDAGIAFVAPPDAEMPEIVMPPDPQPDRKPPPERKLPPPPQLSADELYRGGLQAFVKGDTRGALALYKKARDANPRFAGAWRGLGLCHEKLGDKASAKAAFTRYLALAPAANDADMVRARLERL